MMADKAVTGLRSIEIAVPDVAKAAEFYESVWGLSAVHNGQNICYLRADGPEHHALVLHEGTSPSIVRVNLSATDRSAVDLLAGALHGSGITVLAPPEFIQEPGGGYGVRFLDPEGREFRVACDVERNPDAPIGSRPRKLAHVVLNARDADVTTRFFVDVLGFRLSDQTRMMDFLRCNADHHSIAVARTGNTSLNHVAYEMASWNELMRACGRMKQSGRNVEWGIGRHGPGDNVFAYFLDPFGYAIEYTAEVQQIDEATHRPGTPKDWARGPNLDAWGFSDPPSEPLRTAMHGHSTAH